MYASSTRMMNCCFPRYFITSSYQKALFSSVSRGTNKMQSVLRYSRSFKLKCSISFPQAGTRDTVRAMNASHFIQDASLTSLLRYKRISKALSEKCWLPVILKRQRKLKSRGHYFGVSQLDDVSLFASNYEDTKLLVMAP